MIRVPARLALVLLIAPLSATSCSSKHTDVLACHSTAVAPNVQPKATTPNAALKWYLAHMAKAAGVPTTGYAEQGHTPSRAVFSTRDGRAHISIGNFGDSLTPSWAVQSTIAC